MPPSLTGGREACAFRLKVVGDHFRGGPVGAIQHVPWWIALGDAPPA